MATDLMKKRRKLKNVTLRPKFQAVDAEEELIRASSPIAVLEGLLNNGVNMEFIVGQLADIAEKGGNSTRLAGVKMLLDCMRPHRLFFEKGGPLALPALPETTEVSRAVETTLKVFREEQDATETQDSAIGS